MRSQLQVNWPYTAPHYGVVYLTSLTLSQEKMMRRLDKSIDTDLVLVICIKTDNHVLVPLRTLIDF